MITELFDGPSAPWWIYALVMLAVVAVLGYLNINLSAKVLTIFLAFELLLITVYDITVLAQGGEGGLGFDSFTPDEFFSGSLIVGSVFAIGLFGGFEATVIFNHRRRARPTPRPARPPT